MAVTSTLSNPFVVKPLFTKEDKTIKTKKRNEFRFVHSAFVPRTIELSYDDVNCSIVLEYIIDEAIGETVYYENKTVQIKLGRHTGKIIEVILKCTDIDSCKHAISSFADKLEEMAKNEREAIQKNYYLVSSSLKELVKVADKDPSLREFFSPSEITEKAA